MEKLLIVKSTATTYADGATNGIWQINSLVTGALAVFEHGGANDGKTISGTVPAVTGNHVSFAIGNTTSSYLQDRSNLMQIKNLKYVKLSPISAVAKVMFVGTNNTNATYDCNISSPPIAGTVLTMRIVDLAKETYDNTRDILVDYMVKVGDDVEDTIDGLVAAINANTSAAALVTAVKSSFGANLGIRLTGVTAGHDFTAKGEDILEDADILEYNRVNGVTASYTTDVTAIDFAHGDATTLALKEEYYSSEVGNINSEMLGSDFWSRASKVESTLSYIYYVITATNDKEDPLQTNGNPYIEKLIIGIDTTNTTVIAALDLILANLI
jgi:hypothetical protein